MPRSFLRAALSLLVVLLPALSGCSTTPTGLQFGRDEGGSTYGLASLPFELRRGDGRHLSGTAAVRLQKVSYFARDKAGAVSCSGGFTLAKDHASVPTFATCSDTGAASGTVTEAYADHGSGTLPEPNGRTASFRYGETAR